MTGHRTLRPDEDAFGAALLAHLEGRADDHTLVLEVDDGRSFPAMAPNAFFARPYEWLPYEREILRDIQGPVLDLGCGAGRHLLWLEENGERATGIDLSPGAVAVCGRRGVTDVRLGDLCDPPDDERWRTVLMMCGNFGLAGGWDESRALLQRLHEVCDAGAILVADSVDPFGNESAEAVAYREAKRAAGRHPGEVTLRLRYGEIATPWWTLLNLPPSDVEPLVDGTGWRVEEHTVYGRAHAIRLRRI